MTGNQPSSSGSSQTGGIDPKLAALLAYLFSVIGGIVFYLISKDKFVRFHAMQSLLLGVAYFVIYFVLDFIPFFFWITWLLWLAFVALSIVMMVKSYGGEKYKLPVIGNIAEKNA
ncbi:MAG: DUF4870 domain-containing protein [Patescibacteria group bacterium]|jgi:uncharacterized membrane protein